MITEIPQSTVQNIENSSNIRTSSTFNLATGQVPSSDGNNSSASGKKDKKRKEKRKDKS